MAEVTDGQMRREWAQRHLRDFARHAWHVVEPETEFVLGWHIDCICEHLEAVSSGELLRLVINIPPRHMKSLLVSVLWFAWSWIAKPQLRWLFNSYAETLSTRDSLKSRRIVESPWYRANWGDRFRLAGDQNLKTRFENDKTGYRISSSVLGANTGEGGDIIVVDDPHNVLEGESEKVRTATTLWWDEVMSTRLNDQKTGKRVIVMQRVHELDLSGKVLKDERGYHHLCLPAEFEPRVLATGERFQPQPHDDCPIAKDPRVELGALLWEAKFGKDEVKALKGDLGTYGAAGQLQQRPVPREGAMFKSAYFRALPDDFNLPTKTGGKPPRQRLPRLTYVDLAWSAKDSADYTVGETGAVDSAGNLYLIDVWRERVDEKDLAVELANLLDRTRPALLGIEIGAYKQAATQDLIVRLMKLLAKKGLAIPVEGIAVTTDKEFRAELPSQRGKAGLIYADRSAPWWTAFEGECLTFPKGANDDQVDALSGLTQLAITASVRHGSPIQARFG